MASPGKTTRIAAINKAIDTAGGIVLFTRDMGLRHQAVYGWKKRGYAPLERALEMEKRYGVSAASMVKPSIASALNDAHSLL